MENRSVSDSDPRPGERWWRVALAMFAVGWGANQFAPMLLVYRHSLGLSPGVLAGLFGVYAIGLVPGLLLGGSASDRLGRRRPVLCFVALSPIATLFLIAGHNAVASLVAGRFVAGVCSGVVFSAASAWMQDLLPRAAAGTAARRTTISLSAGFGTGPLVAGALAQWAPAPLWLPYLPHLALGVVALVVLLGAADTSASRTSGSILFRFPHSVRSSRFRSVVAPLAPWVFGSASIAGIALPGLIRHAPTSAVLVAGIVNAVTLGMGVVVQPLARRIDGRRPLAGALIGLGAVEAGLAVGILALSINSEALILLAALPLGGAYGLILVSGLLETERLARADERGATIAVYYALTYTGFVVPYLISELSRAFGAIGALVVLGVVAASAAGVLRRALPGRRAVT